MPNAGYFMYRLYSPDTMAVGWMEMDEYSTSGAKFQSRADSASYLNRPDKDQVLCSLRRIASISSP
jgi:hypothetical protein